MKHLLDEVTPQNGHIDLRALCGSYISVGDQLVVHMTNPWGVCLACRDFWARAKTEERKALADIRNSARAQEAAARLDGSHPMTGVL
jgi:hypothetical protein